ncbi:hypothetical protein MKI84_05600 [Ancylobacter sp. A5.8]|uniref:hypothetical protein n=1 Tax=Ancylobacter gelatini TaxID=2919920 RepID=UPI001F4E222E|nr:hypothetical protein [Ancylobacter gelatini]MCJ8142384.1 hypothetical protein [Ancylobacter gelatini]
MTLMATMDVGCARRRRAFFRARARRIFLKYFAVNEASGVDFRVSVAFLPQCRNVRVVFSGDGLLFVFDSLGDGLCIPIGAVNRNGGSQGSAIKAWE